MKNFLAHIHAAIVVIWFTVIITIIGEFIASFKDALKGLTGHHWATKSILAIILYIMFVSLVPHEKKPKEKEIIKGVNTLIYNVVIASLLFLIFFIWHFLAK